MKTSKLEKSDKFKRPDLVLKNYKVNTKRDKAYPYVIALSVFLLIVLLNIKYVEWLMFLDRCDKCHLPKKCRGFNGMILCDDCIESLKDNTDVQEDKDDQVYQNDIKEITIFDFL